MLDLPKFPRLLLRAGARGVPALLLAPVLGLMAALLLWFFILLFLEWSDPCTAAFGSWRREKGKDNPRRKAGELALVAYILGHRPFSAIREWLWAALVPAVLLLLMRREGIWETMVACQVIGMAVCVEMSCWAAQRLRKHLRGSAVRASLNLYGQLGGETQEPLRQVRLAPERVIPGLIAMGIAVLLPPRLGVFSGLLAIAGIGALYGAVAARAITVLRDAVMARDVEARRLVLERSCLRYTLAYARSMAALLFVLCAVQVARLSLATTSPAIRPRSAVETFLSMFYLGVVASCAVLLYTSWRRWHQNSPVVEPREVMVASGSEQQASVLVWHVRTDESPPPVPTDWEAQI